MRDRPTSRRGGVGRSMIALACLFATGCILLISPDDYGPHCQFAGIGTPCGACVESACQAEMDTCCADPACGPTLSLVESCTTGDIMSCTIIPDDIGASTPSRVSLARCVFDKCATTCNRITSCSAPDFGLGQTCTCTVETPANATPCSESAYPNTKCCAPEGYPMEGQQCTCNVLNCMPSGASCFCLLFDTPPVCGETAECKGTHCCQSYDSCMCAPEPCDPSTKEVPECDLAHIGCPVNTVEVSSCTATQK